MWLIALFLAVAAAALALLSHGLRRAVAELDELAGTPTGCAGWPMVRDSVQPDIVCQGCACWRSSSARRDPPPAGIVVLASGMYCPRRRS